MNTERLYTQLSANDYAAFTETAKLHALRIRREVIDQFWSALGRRLVMAGTTLLSTRKRRASHSAGVRPSRC